MESISVGRQPETAMLSPGSMTYREGREGRYWYAVFTLPQHERSIERRLSCRGIFTFLPTYETERVWRNRQRVRIQSPVFSRYLFVHLQQSECRTVMNDPGVLCIVGNSRGPVAIADAEIDYLRMAFGQAKIEPYLDLEIGQKVRIKSGPMNGLEGHLVKKKNSLKLILHLALIRLSAAVEINATDIEPIPAALA